MNLIDAVKSGKPFRRASWSPDCWYHNTSADVLQIGVDSVVADDWEIQETAVSITRTQFFEAAESVKVTVRDSVGYKEISLCDYLTWPITGAAHLSTLAKRLGLE